MWKKLFPHLPYFFGYAEFYSHCILVEDTGIPVTLLAHRKIPGGKPQVAALHLLRESTVPKAINFPQQFKKAQENYLELVCCMIPGFHCLAHFLLTRKEGNQGLTTIPRKPPLKYGAFENCYYQSVGEIGVQHTEMLQNIKEFQMLKIQKSHQRTDWMLYLNSVHL